MTDKEIRSKRWRESDFPDGKLPKQYEWVDVTTLEDRHLGERWYVAGFRIDDDD